MRKEKTIIYIIGIALVAGFAALIVFKGGSNDSGAITYSTSELLVVKNITPGQENQLSDWDFGTISMKNGKAAHVFELKNDGDESIKIKEIYTSCMCTTASVTDDSGKKYGPFGMQGHELNLKTSIEVRPDETVELEVVFDPSAHGPSGTGKVKRIIYVETNSQTKPKIQLTFEADVTK